MSSGSSQTGNLKTWWRSRNLQSSDASARARAVEKLGEGGNRDVAPVMIEMLGDTAPEVRASASAALGSLGAIEAIEPLAAILFEEKDQGVREAAMAALKTLDAGAAAQALVPGMTHEDMFVRQNAAAALRQVGWDRLSDVEHARVAIVQNAWDEVCAFRDAALEPLCEVVRNGTDHARRTAAEAIGQIGSRCARDILVSLMADVSLESSSREVVGWALGRFFAERLDDVCRVRLAIVEGDWAAAGAFGDVAIEPFHDALQNADVEVRAKAAAALGEMKTSQSVGLLIGTLGDPQQDATVREAAARGMGGVDDESVRQALASALSDPSWAVREAAADSLRNLKWAPTTDQERTVFAIVSRYWDDLVTLGPAAVDSLVEALCYRSVSRPAAETLLRIGSDGLDRLLAVLRDPDQTMGVREIVASVLAEAGDPRAIEPIVAMLDQSDIVLRQVAVWTLQQIGWEPADDRQRAQAAIALDEWDELAALGPAAVEPLLMLAAESMAMEETLKALRQILESSTQALTVDQLRTVAALGDGQVAERMQAAKYSGDADSVAVAADCDRVRTLARGELGRRGLMS